MPKLSYLAKLPTGQTNMVEPHVIELIISVNNIVDIGTIYVLSDINKFKWNKRFMCIQQKQQILLKENQVWSVV